MLPTVNLSPIRDRQLFSTIMPSFTDYAVFEQPPFSLQDHVVPFAKLLTKGTVSKDLQEEYLREILKKVRARSTPTVTMVCASPNDVRARVFTLWLLKKIWRRYEKEHTTYLENRKLLTQNISSEKKTIISAPIKPIFHWLSLSNFSTNTERDILNKEVRPSPHFLVISGIFNAQGDELNLDEESILNGPTRMSLYKREKLRAILELYSESHRIVIASGMTPATLALDELQYYYNYGFQLFSSRQNVYPTVGRRKYEEPTPTKGNKVSLDKEIY